MQKYFDHNILIFLKAAAGNEFLVQRKARPK